jgi:tetratricopeptide (TPR) repeat protein
MKKLLFLFFISGFSKCSFSQDADFYNFYFEGNALLVKGQYDKAIEKYNSALKLAEIAYVYYNRGNAYYGKKDFTNALSDFNKTIKLNDSYAEAYCQRGLVKNALGDKTCCDDLKKAVKLDMESAKEFYKTICK